jgi:hypothetical protein
MIYTMYSPRSSPWNPTQAKERLDPDFHGVYQRHKPTQEIGAMGHPSFVTGRESQVSAMKKAICLAEELLRRSRTPERNTRSRMHTRG